MNLIKWTFESLKQEALKYKFRSEFMRKNSGAYQTAKRSEFRDIIFAHMPKNKNIGSKSHNKIWDVESIKKESLKYKKLSDFFKNNRGAYRAAIRNNIFDEVTSHMKKRKIKWDVEELKKEAAKYNTIKEFDEKSPGAYSSALKRGLLKDIGKHFKHVGIVSKPEKELFSVLKNTSKEIKSLRFRNIHVHDKPHIKGFYLDIYDPKTNKGIEFDGRYWHSFDGLKKGREHWPDCDIYGYHQIKDGYFASRGITILHILEEDWLVDKQKCIDKCIEFLKSQ